MSNPNENSVDASVLQKKIVIKVFGVGGAGCNCASAMARDFTDVSFYAINTDAQALQNIWLHDKFILGKMLMRGLGAGGDPEVGRAAAEQDVESLREYCKGADIIFIMAGLGGGTGGGAGPVLAQVAKESGALVLGIVTLPFEFEGGRRLRQAQLSLQQLKAAADAVICLPNQKLFKFIDEKTNVLEAFKISTGLLSQGVRGIWRLLTQPGLINVDFADLCSVTRGRHAESFFATADASGDSRVDVVVEKLLAHPMLEDGRVLGDAETVLVSLVGGPDLTMSDVNRLMEKLNRQCEDAKLTFGAAIDPSYSNRMAVTVIASRHQGAEVKAPTQTAMQPNPREMAPPQVASPFLDTTENTRTHQRFVAPPPAMSDDTKEQLLTRQRGGRVRKKAARNNQRELPLDIVSKSRFDKSEPTIRHGEDLDEPTFIRRGVVLN